MMIRVAPIAALLFAGLTASAAAQFLGPGLPMPGQQQQQQMPPCYAEFQPLKAEAEKRGLAVKAGMEKKVSREEACSLLKRYSDAEARIVKYIQDNSQNCGIPAEASTSMKANHSRTLKTVNQVCSAAGPAKPTGPGLSEALGTARSGALDPLAPNNGTLDSLTGTALTR